MFLTGLLVLGTKESARFNLIITVAHLVLVVFIIIAGGFRAVLKNRGLLETGARGFDGL